MKKTILSLLLTLSATLSAESGWNYKLWGPFASPNHDHRKCGYTTYGDFMVRASIQDKCEKSSFSFWETGIETYTPIWHPRHTSDVFFLTAGVSNSNVSWDSDVFESVNASTLHLGVGLTTKSIRYWEIKGLLRFNWDYNPDFDFDSYLGGDLVLWGRYWFNQCLGLHLGVIALVGPGTYHYYPIIGFDYKFHPRLKINMIFPLDMRMIFMVNDYWDWYVGARFIESRHRASRKNFDYISYGAEVGAIYQYSEKLYIDFHMGLNLGGTIKAERECGGSKKNDFNESFYGGFEIAGRF